VDGTAVTRDSAPAPIELLLPRQMADADQWTIDAGTPGIELMERAGNAVATEAAEMLPDFGKVLVLCGPGNNGGDGYVAARLLEQSGYRVALAALDPAKPLKGDAALAASRWGGEVGAASDADMVSFDLVIDALFGTGVTGELVGMAATIVHAINSSKVPVLSVDGPSGYDLADGVCAGPVVQATRTVTFFRLKPGHVIQPDNPCGNVKLHQIGISSDALPHVWSPDGKTYVNAPELWHKHLSGPAAGAHKYTRGHTVVVSGKASATGAARLAARGALRMGSGLVTVASPPDAVLVNAAHLTAIMVRKFRGADGLAEVLSDERHNAVVIGPGAGVGEATRENILACLASSAHVVLDADALMSFVGHQQVLRDAVDDKAKGSVVITPHAGEYARFFDGGSASSLADVRMRSAKQKWVTVAKGPTTIVAEPGEAGRAAINTNAPPTLATAGSGDVLTGFIASLLAQGLPAFEAASAAVWLHGECANAFGQGLIAEDLPEMLPAALQNLQPGT